MSSIRYHAGKAIILIVDDGSDEPVSEERLKERFSNFAFHIIRQTKNAGITLALNAGLKWIQEHAHVKYIARLDCGDICHPDRFIKQAAFLNNHPEIGLLGTWCYFESATKKLSYTYVTPTTHNQIMPEMCSRNVFIHPTVIFRSELLSTVGYYPLNYETVEDYAYFWSILHKTKGAVLNECLVTCEINADGISISKRRRQLLGRMKVVRDFADPGPRKALGILKLKLLMLIPYTAILRLKQMRS